MITETMGTGTCACHSVLPPAQRWVLLRERTVQDIAEVEQTLRANIYPPDLLRDPHAVLRGFRTLLFVENGALSGAEVVSSLPKVTVLLHLFSRLPAAVPMPHQRTGVAAGQYSKWLDQHSTEEAVESIRHSFGASDLSGADAAVVAVIEKLLAA